MKAKYNLFHQLSGPPRLVPSQKQWEGIHFDRSGCDHGKHIVTVLLFCLLSFILTTSVKAVCRQVWEKNPKQIGNDYYGMWNVNFLNVFWLIVRKKKLK